ncbi:biotin/lipoyl-binding protein [Thermohalobacter berrensis]|uniref:biotin/lipoyl-binding protein n=1 Tax=Thermohalobacter berrensis TaxID=99594 RepID=UPI000E7225BD|nr:biotin/lipoyl-binding protein [Thermohalobacter berrensis]
MKKIKINLLIFFLMLMVGCSQVTKDKSLKNEEKKLIRVIETEEVNLPVTLNYKGFVSYEDLKKYSFKLSGMIKKIYVTEGQYVKKGDPLAKLDDKDINYGLNVAKLQLDAAKAQYDKAIKGATKQEKIKLR